MRNILATSSTLALVIGIATEVEAAAVRTLTGSPAATSNGANMGGTFNSGDSIRTHAIADNINIDSAKTIAGIDLNGFAATGTITASSSATLGSIGNVSAGSSIALKINDGITVTLNGTKTIGGVVVANTYSGLGPVTIGNTTAPGALAALSVTATGAVTFSCAIDSLANTTANWGTLNVSGANHIFNGIVGGTSKVGVINITSGHQIRFNANVTASSINLQNVLSIVRFTSGIITSQINTTNPGNGKIYTSGGPVSIRGDIGSPGMSLNMVQPFSDTTFKGNIYSDIVIAGTLLGGGGLVSDTQLIFMGGTALAPNIVSGRVYNLYNPLNYGGLNVGSTTETAHIQFSSMVGGLDGDNDGYYSIPYLDVKNGSSATLLADSVFSSAGTTMSIGAGSTITLGNTTTSTPITVTFQNGGTINGAASGNGTLVIVGAVGTALPWAVGAVNALDTIRLHKFNNNVPASLGNSIYATNLDLTEGSIIALDNYYLPNITNLISSDNSGEVYYDSPGGLVVPIDISLPLTLKNTGILTVSNATGGVTFDATAGNTPTLILDDTGSISDITVVGGNAGTIQTLGNATFTGVIGGNGASLNSFTSIGTGAEIIDITTATDIYAATILYDSVILNANVNSLNIHSTSYTMNDTTLNAGIKTITITGGTATLAGNIVINATYTGTGQTVLDLSGAAVTDNTVISLTFNIAGGAPASDDTIIVVKGLVNTIAPALGATDPLWTVSTDTPGTLVYDPTPPPTPPAPVPTPAPTPLGPTFFTNGDYHDLIFTNTIATNIHGADIGQPVLDIDTSQLKISRDKKAFLEFVGDKLAAQEAKSSAAIYVTPRAAVIIASDALEQGIMPAEFAYSLQNPDSGISEELTTDIVSVTTQGEAAATNEMLTRLNSGLNGASNLTDSAQAYTDKTFDILASRFASSITTALASNVIPKNNVSALGSGVAAGGSSPYDRLGVWCEVIGSTAIQKPRSNNSGFRSFSQGVVVGVDTMLNDSAIVGIALSNSSTNVKYKNHVSGNKSTASSWGGAVFGNYQFTNNWFIRGSGLFNKTHVNDKNLKLVRQGIYGLAKAKYNLIFYGIETSVGFIHSFSNQMLLIPTIGVRVVHSNKMSYSETGSTNQNIKDISHKAMNHYSALYGLSITKTIERSDLSFVPELHANFQYGINLKTPNGSFVSPLTPTHTTTFVGTKATKLISTYGGSMSAGGEKVECSFGGDVILANKYVGYQGSIKFKVKF